MLGAIVGDIIGSVRENLRVKRKDFELFPRLSFYTDDTVLTVAVADAILNGKSYGKTIKAYARRHPLRGYGVRCKKITNQHKNNQPPPETIKMGSGGKCEYGNKKDTVRGISKKH